ncbi:ABC transporter permease [Amycolatopsis acidiphila]|uniref:ABC transporter permease n=1 Tax=Amycolatopsis acidiphila TaxID=715473 RepID=A0A558AJV3_9PSEU|nr:ABC transporter permease [Amycolatopsis acidiphila]TVT24529.1 ABC transporter permease [Amycolatopsis acidiphila]UIJ59260.1 ABC transporter permease [Amycolatopsis acidiphila]GHG79377.1 ABC transporter permease [Amycolatopsis acidiphila]
MTVPPTKAIALVAKRELNTRLRTRSFLVGTIVILVVLAGYLLLQANLFSNASKAKVGLTGQTIGIAQQLQTAGGQIGKEIRTSVVANPEQGRAEVESGDLDILLSGNAADLQVLVKSDLDPQLRTLFNGISHQQVLNAKLLEGDLDPAQVMREVNSAQVDLTQLEPPDPGRGQRLAIGLITVFLLFFGIQTYGAFVAQGVIEEKSSRVVELLLSTVRPWQLMVGKVLGLGLVGLVQIVVLAVGGLAMASATGALTLSGLATGTVLWGVVWYLLGFFLYATVYAAAGSLVSRQEDAASVITPVTMVFTIGFVVGFNVLAQNPDSGTARVLSLVPLFSPILMPARMAIGSAAGWEVVLSLVLTLVLGSLLTWVGSRIYRNAVLHTGSRLKLTAALRG